jgi:hypothetical protein
MYLREGTCRREQKKYFWRTPRQEQNPMNRALGSSARQPFRRLQSSSEKAVSRVEYAPETQGDPIPHRRNFASSKRKLKHTEYRSDFTRHQANPVYLLGNPT